MKLEPYLRGGLTSFCLRLNYKRKVLWVFFHSSRRATVCGCGCGHLIIIIVKITVFETNVNFHPSKIPDTLRCCGTQLLILQKNKSTHSITNLLFHNGIINQYLYYLAVVLRLNVHIHGIKTHSLARTHALSSTHSNTATLFSLWCAPHHCSTLHLLSWCN